MLVRGAFSATGMVWLLLGCAQLAQKAPLCEALGNLGWEVLSEVL